MTGSFCPYYNMESFETPKIPYQDKQPALDITSQIDLLLQKGLVINDQNTAKAWLQHISYFRFKQYSYSFKDYGDGDGNYIKGTTFEDVCSLYRFDSHLRKIVFGALEAIEVSVKTCMSNIMSLKHGTHWYDNAGLFISEQERRNIVKDLKAGEEVPKLFDHAEFMKNIDAEMDYPSQSYLANYKKFYEPKHPPSWMMMETITFGTLSMMFENLKPSDEKTAIFETYGLTKKSMVSWLHSFSFIRNKCAHHNRLVYSKINFAPSMPLKRSRQFLEEADLVNHDTLYAVLCCMQYMLDRCYPDADFKTSLIALLDVNPTIDFDRLGFTENWREEPLWK